MKTKNRYIFLFMLFILLTSIFLYASKQKNTKNQKRGNPSNSPLSRYDGKTRSGLLSFWNPEEFGDYDDHIQDPSKNRESQKRVYKARKCRMDTCFDSKLCRKNGFKIYVYPNPVGEKMSENYRTILQTIRDSRYYTSSPDLACLFVVSYDTLDRDKLSTDYIKNLNSKLTALKYWNNGRNHVIFNLYSGTWPDYYEDMEVDLGEAILAKASFGETFYRPDFDISFPLFKLYPQKAGQPGYLTRNEFPPLRKYLLSFKGKRYTYGIGSKTRNALYHIHNNEDIIMLTTCKHGKNWEKHMDKRCLIDNEEYDKYDYMMLLHNSTFCLTPRGRRLGSFRFLESLQAACVPLILANGWKLPFAEVIDWSKASITWDENLLFQVPTMIRNIDQDKIMMYRQQSQFLWNSYFSSLEKIVLTTFEIIHDRVFPELARPPQVWNTPPGGLAYIPSYSTSISSYPFYYNILGENVEAPQNFTAVIQAISPVTSSASPIIKLIKVLQTANSCSQIIVLWHCEKPPPPMSRWPVLPDDRVKFSVIDDQDKVMSRRFFPFNEIENEVVLSLDDDINLNNEEVDFSFDVWRTFPDRIVGFPARNHLWDVNHDRWGYTSKWANNYSIILTGASYIHKSYFSMYTNLLPKELLTMVDSLNNCEDLLMNLLVAHVTKLPPIKVTQKKQYKNTVPQAPNDQDVSTGQGVKSKWSDPQHFAQRQVCINKFVESFGYMPLIHSKMRLDPAFYKDQVSVKRKRYPKVEL